MLRSPLVRDYQITINMNKKMKIYYMGRRINGQFDSFKARVRRLVQWTVRVGVVAGMAMGFFMAGGLFYSTSTVTAHTNTVQLPVEAPVLDRIADCESGVRKPSGMAVEGSARHLDPKTGQVIMRANTNGTVDIGKYQINEYYWGKKASELGLDLTKEKDNKAMAEWIYKNKGTTDWSSSQKCWYR